MNKLLIVLCASAFAFGSASVLAGNTMKPLSKMETQEAKAARDAAKAKWDAMTPDQQAAARKAARAKKLQDATALDMVASENMQLDTAQAKKDAAASHDIQAGDGDRDTEGSEGRDNSGDHVGDRHATVLGHDDGLRTRDLLRDFRDYCLLLFQIQTHCGLPWLPVTDRKSTRLNSSHT